MVVAVGQACETDVDCNMMCQIFVLSRLQSAPDQDQQSSKLQLCRILGRLNLLRIHKSALLPHLIHDFHDKNTLI